MFYPENVFAKINNESRKCKFKRVLPKDGPRTFENCDVEVEIADPEPWMEQIVFRIPSRQIAKMWRDQIKLQWEMESHVHENEDYRFPVQSFIPVRI